jgi:hypothetical protein
VVHNPFAKGESRTKGPTGVMGAVSRSHRGTAPPGGGGGCPRGPRQATAAVLGTAAVVVAGWVAAPWIAMARRGTLDDRHVRAWADETAPDPPPVLPSPRRPLALEHSPAL